MGPNNNGSPQYNLGDRVHVGTMQMEWIVIRVLDQRPGPAGRMEFYYELQDSKNGDMYRSWENDMRSTEEIKAASKKAKVTFESVIIEDDKRQQIIEALEQVNKQDLIFKVWGFEETIEKGRGVSLLFYGPPGTGKTLMAQAIANKMGYKLTVISTADIESSVPGEAERNIRKHFSEAKGKKSIILFDECDSMIYTRSGVGPILSAQINELLSQIERFDGITIFTTNRLGTLDEAVNRRLALKLEFAMPSVEQRIKIWKRMFPSKAPLSRDIKWAVLAETEITGGYIKNCVLRAARMAACEKGDDKNKKIRMKHLERALQLEAESMQDFENARQVHRSGIGHIDRSESGGLVVGQQVGAGTDADMVMKNGQISKQMSRAKKVAEEVASGK